MMMVPLLHVLPLLTPLRLIAISPLVYLAYRLITRVIHEWQLVERFNKLPKLPTAGLAGQLLLGNVDAYYYSMRHLSIPQGAFQMISAVFQFESLRNSPHGFVALNIGFQKVVIFFRADTVESLVSSTVNITKSEHYDYMRPWLGTGLLTSSGDHWRRHRKALTPAFHFKLLESFAPVMNSNVKVLLGRVEKLTSSPNNNNQEAIDIRSLICDMALDIICETAMGTNVGAQSESDDKEAYRRPIEIATEQLVRRFVNPLYRSDLLYSLSADGAENRRVMGKIHHFVKRVIKERKEFLQSKLQAEEEENQRESRGGGAPEEEPLVKEKHPFLDSLLLTHFKNPLEFTETDILDEVNTFMVAGHDTTAEGIIWTMLLIGNDSRVQAAIAAELEQVFAGEEDDCEITTEHCRQMKYLEMAIKEALRIFPSVPSAARKVDQDFTVNGHVIPAGCTAIIFIHLLHKDPKYFPKPEQYIPERFLADSDVYKVPYAYMPFSAGARNCVGQKFAMLEMKITLASIFRKYTIKATTHREEVKVDFGSVLTAASPVMIQFTKRVPT